MSSLLEVEVNKVELLYSILDDHIMMLGRSERITEHVKSVANELTMLCEIIEEYESKENTSEKT